MICNRSRGGFFIESLARIRGIFAPFVGSPLSFSDGENRRSEMRRQRGVAKLRGIGTSPEQIALGYVHASVRSLSSLSLRFISFVDITYD